MLWAVALHKKEVGKYVERLCETHVVAAGQKYCTTDGEIHRGTRIFVGTIEPRYDL